MMKVPKSIEKLILRRAKLVNSLQIVNYELDEWLDKNGVDVKPCDYRGGVEIYENPYESIERVIKAIETR